MNIAEFLADLEWDAPFVKKLAQYETPQGNDHIGGFNVGQKFVENFPHLSSDDVNNENPTNEKWLKVDMYVGTQYVETSPVRYHFQTRGGKRRPEYWMTHVNTLRKAASVGDLWITQRKIGSIGDHYRFILLKDEKEKAALENFNFPKKPLPFDQIELIGRDIEEKIHQKFQDTQKRTTTSVERAVRDSLFRNLLLEQYNQKCCVSRLKLFSLPEKLNEEEPDPKPIYEVEAAHIKPVKHGGPDDIRNGILLSRTFHWAFDQGLFTVNKDFKVEISRKAPAEIKENLKEYKRKKILLPKNKELVPHPDALAWHKKEIFQN
jgi:putative restriction endonuclease